MDRTSNISRIMAGLAAVGAGLMVLAMPAGLIEMVIASSGLSEIIPAAAPPLGLTARALLAGFAALMATGVMLALGRTGRPQGEEKMGFALSRLTAFARGRGRSVSAGGLPALRRADAHPDAPARRPIFASRDFGQADIFTRPLPDVDAMMVEGAEEPIVDGAGLAMPRAPEPLADEEIIRVISAAVTPAPVAAPAPAVAPATPAPTPASTDDLSIAELAARFERGLARRSALTQAAHAVRHAETILAETTAARMAYASNGPVLADIPPAAPVPVKADVDAEIDEALRAALGTLHRMTTRAR